MNKLTNDNHGSVLVSVITFVDRYSESRVIALSYLNHHSRSPVAEKHFGHRRETGPWEMIFASTIHQGFCLARLAFYPVICG